MGVFEIVVWSILGFIMLAILFTYIKNSVKISKEEKAKTAKKPEAKSDAATAGVKGQEPESAAKGIDLLDKGLLKDDYLRKVFNEKVESENKSSFAPAYAEMSIAEVSDIIKSIPSAKRAEIEEYFASIKINIKESDFEVEDLDFEKNYLDDYLTSEEYMDESIADSSMPSVSQEFDSLSPRMKALIVTNLLGNKKSDD